MAVEKNTRLVLVVDAQKKNTGQLHALKITLNKWVFPKIGVPQNGWFVMEHPIKMDDLGVPLFSETSKCSQGCVLICCLNLFQ